MTLVEKGLQNVSIDLSARSAAGHVDFGSDYDCFDAMSHTASREVSQHAIANRRYLVEVMARFGFENYDKEWWHFTHRPEPFPDTYFDFPIVMSRL